MPLSEAQKRAKEKYRKTDNGRRIKSKSDALSFIRHQALTKDLLDLKAEIERVLKLK